MRNNIILLILTAICILGCNKENTDYTNLKSLYIDSDYDTVQVYESFFSKKLTLKGVFEEEIKNTIYNKGITTGSQYSFYSLESVATEINSEDALWHSSNTSVATVSNGKVYPNEAGYTEVYAIINDVKSNVITINVLEKTAKPFLDINIPEIIVVFENLIKIEGITNENSTVKINGVNVNVNINGKFTLEYTQLVEGKNTITVVSYNSNDNSISTSNTIIVYYYPYLTKEADDIVGTWQGTFGSKTFNFTITEGSNEYIVEGKIDIEFDLIGLITGITFAGKINKSGQLDIGINKTIAGKNTTISGSITGRLTSTSTITGSINVSAKQGDWITIGFSKEFTAEKQ